LHLNLLLLEVVALFNGVFLGNRIDHQLGHLALSGVSCASFLAERPKHFDHVVAVVDPIHQVLLLLALNLRGQLSNSALDLLQLSIFSFCLLLDCQFFAFSFFLYIFVVFILSLQRF